METAKHPSRDPAGGRLHGRPARIAILGSYPPPHGGVANHVFRLCGQLEQRGISYVVYNAVTNTEAGDRVVSVTHDRQRWLLRYLASAREEVIYILSDRLAAWAIGAALSKVRRKRVIVRLRNATLPTLIAESPARARLAGALLRRMSGVVTVSEFLADSTRRVGVVSERIHTIPGFLPPRASEFDTSLVAPEVLEFVERRSPVIVASGRVAWHGGEDLYGLDMLVELARRLHSDHPRLGVVLCFFDHAPAEEARLQELRRRVVSAGLSDVVYFNTVAGPLMPVLVGADLFVRPTNTDGDANTVREALALGVPTVASDVVIRPSGALIFAARDDDAFEAAVRRALRAAPAAKERMMPKLSAKEDARIDDYIAFLLNADVRKSLDNRPETGAESEP